MNLISQKGPGPIGAVPQRSSEPRHPSPTENPFNYLFTILDSFDMISLTKVGT